MRTPTLLHVAALVLGSLALASPSPADVVVPNQFANTPAPQGNALPFSWMNSHRFQQVYAASEFPAGTLQISEIAFRLDQNHAAVSETLSDVELRLSTSATGHSISLSSTYDDNVGADELIVISQGPLNFNSPGTGPMDTGFDFVFPLETPFFYDTAAGALLLDVRVVMGGVPTTQFALDAVDDSGVTQRLICLANCDVNDLSGNTSDAGTVVTHFTVPEPAAVGLALSALAALGALAGSARRRA